MTMTAQEMAAHVETLCSHHRIKLVYYKGDGRAFASREVHIPPVKGVRSYYTALHEIGHVIGKGRSAPKLEAEANAWQYAIDTAKRPPTPGVRRMISRCLHSYLNARTKGYGRRQTMKLPPDDHIFWRLLEETA